MQRAMEGEGPTRFGVSVVLRQMKIEEGLFDIVLNRFESADSITSLYKIVSPPFSSI